MSIADDLEKLLAIKQDLFKSIRTKTDIQSDTLFEDYCKKIDAIKVESNVTKPFFTFYDDSPRVQNFVFGGGVSKEMGGIYFGNKIDFFDGVIATCAVEIGNKFWGSRGLSTIDAQYLSIGDIDVPNFTFVEAQPTCTNKVFGPEDASSSFEIF